MACRDCGKPADGHGRYCNPILDRLIAALIVLALVAVSADWYLWVWR